MRTLLFLSMRSSRLTLLCDVVRILPVNPFVVSYPIMPLVVQSSEHIAGLCHIEPETYVFRNFGRSLKLPYFVSCAGCDFETSLAYYVSQMIDGFSDKLIFFDFNSATNVLQECKDFPNIVDVFHRCLREYKYVVQIDQCDQSFYGYINNVHISLEGSSCSLKSGWHASESVQSKMSGE